jgi:hypothetical protein
VHDAQHGASAIADRAQLEENRRQLYPAGAKKLIHAAQWKGKAIMATFRTNARQ